MSNSVNNLVKFTALNRPPAADFGIGIAYQEDINAIIECDGVTWTARGNGLVANRPSAALLGPGTWQDGSKLYISNGTTYTDAAGPNTNLQLLKWRAALAKQQTGVSNAKILFIGDSTEMGLQATPLSAGARQLAISDCVARSFINAGISANVSSQIGGAGLPTIADVNGYNPTITPGAGWSITTSVAISQIFTNTTTTNSLDFTPIDANGVALSFDTIEVYYVNYSAYAHFTVGVDGGAAAFTSTPAGAPLVNKAIVTVPLGTHTVNFGKAAGDAALQVTIVGWVCYNSAIKQVLCLNAGVSGAGVGILTSSPGFTTSASQIAAIAPDLSILNCIINDSGTNYDKALYKSKLQTLITACAQYGSVVLRPGNPVQPRDMSAYLDINHQLATENNIPIIDIQAETGTWTEYNALGMMYDALHPNKNGYRDIANVMAKVIKP
jgi:hypothetical protein